MRFLKTALATAGASALLVGTLAAPALADENVPLYGGTTQITTVAKVVPYLTGHGIVMTPGEEATNEVIIKNGVVRQRFGFGITTPSNLMLEDDPITNEVGSVVGGSVGHFGAVKFLNTNKGKTLMLGGFVVNFDENRVFATTLNGDPIDPVAAFRLVVIDPPLYPVYDPVISPTTATVSGINLYVTRNAAKTLNETLGTHAFKTDGTMKFAKVVTMANLVAPV